MAMTLDGKTVRPDGRWHGISSPRDRARMDEIRREHDAVLAGKNSVLNDDPNLLPAGDPGGPLPLPILLARSELYPLDRRVFKQDRRRPLLLVNRGLRSGPTPAGSPDRPAYWNALDARADLHWVERADFEPARLFRILHERGLRRLLLETGPGFNYGVLAADLLDVLYITLAPFVFGRTDLPGIAAGEEVLPDFDRAGWRLERCQAVDREVFLEYRRIRSPSVQV